LLWKGEKVEKVDAAFGLLAAMMLVASPALAHQGGPHHGNKYSKNYYPNTYFKYCEPDGAQYYGETEASNHCAQYLTEYHKKWYKGKKYYYAQCPLPCEDPGRRLAF
jgi:hypothetical protein